MNERKYKLNYTLFNVVLLLVIKNDPKMCLVISNRILQYFEKYYFSLLYLTKHILNFFQNFISLFMFPVYLE